MNYFLIAHRKIFHSQAVTLRYVFIYLFIYFCHCRHILEKLSLQLLDSLSPQADLPGP